MQIPEKIWCVPLIVTIFIIICFGAFLRIKDKSDPQTIIAKYNMIAYYYDISNRLNQTNVLPQIDPWRLAPDTIIENCPPGLPYFTVILYRFIRTASPHLSFAEFSFILPIITYGIWVIGGILLISNLFSSKLAAIIFIIGLSFVPVSITLTRYGNYTEEFLGSMLVFFSTGYYLLWLKTKTGGFFYGSLISLVLLETTWQQFHIVLLTMCIGALSSYNRHIVIKTVILIIGSLICSQVLCLIFGSRYSPLSMLYELYYGIRYYHSEFIRTAMARDNWRNLQLKDLFSYFSYFGVIVGGIAGIKMIVNINKLYMRVLIIGTAFSFFTMFFLIKSRFLFLSFFLLCIGALNLKKHIRWNVIKKYALFFFNIKHALLLIGLTVIIISFFLILNNIWSTLFWYPPEPHVSIEPISMKVTPGKSIPVNIALSNSGSPQLKEKAAFSGMHIEVKNASVSAISAMAEGTTSEILLPKNAQFSPDIYWFETIYQFLGANKKARVSFTITPYNNKEVLIIYRAWIPGQCSIWNRLTTIVTMQKSWVNWTNSWRNEKCIIRDPRKDDINQNKVICKVKVYAAHKDLQDYYCYEKKLEDDLSIKDNLQSSIERAYKWIQTNINPKTGMLEYMYYPDSDTFSTQNNATRQLAALWTIENVQIFLNRFNLNPLVQKTLDYYLSYKFVSKETQSAYLKINKKMLINNNAFIILTLLQYPYFDKDTLLKQFGNGILDMQKTDGSYLLENNSSTEIEKNGISSGEAMLALMKLYEHTKDKKYLDSVKRAFVFYRKYWKEKRYFFIQWQTQALVLLYKETGDSDIARFIFEMNDWVIYNQQVIGHSDPRYIGGIPKEDPNINTSVILEGLSDSYKLAYQLDDKKHMELYEKAIRMGLQFAMSLQVPDNNTFKNPQHAKGGFAFSLKDTSQMIDNTMDSIDAFIKITSLSFWKE